MFKRVDKKRRKREEEEELGLDEEMKEIMGLNDTDSEESASESDSGSDKDSDAEQSDEGDVEEAGEDSGDDMEDVDTSEDDEPPITLSEVLRDPVYVVSLDPDVRACILCRGKVIKGTPMSQVHKTSTAHKRRFNRFKSLSANIDPDTDAWQIVRILQQESSTQDLPKTEHGKSKRVLKRIAKQASIREKRTLHKKLRAKAKAKKASKDVSQSRGAVVEESLASEQFEPQKAGAQLVGSAKKVANEGQKKAAKFKLDDANVLGATPQPSSEPQKKKRKVQNDSTTTFDLQQTSRRSPGKPFGKSKAPRKKSMNKS